MRLGSAFALIFSILSPSVYASGSLPVSKGNFQLFNESDVDLNSLHNLYTEFSRQRPNKFILNAIKMPVEAIYIKSNVIPMPAMGAMGLINPEKALGRYNFALRAPHIQRQFDSTFRPLDLLYAGKLNLTISQRLKDGSLRWLLATIKPSVSDTKVAGSVAVTSNLGISKGLVFESTNHLYKSLFTPAIRVALRAATFQY